jgi:long-chain acyl-CoA synthetase
MENLELSTFASRIALIWKEQKITYQELHERTSKWKEKLTYFGIKPGDSVAIVGDYSPGTISLLIALSKNKNIIVPLTKISESENQYFFGVVDVSTVFFFDQDFPRVEHRQRQKDPHHLLSKLRLQGAPGMVIFTSGSTGENKGALHNLNNLLGKSSETAKSYITAAFLLWDHIGGQNTLLKILSVGGTIVFLEKRDADSVCSEIEKHKVELLPTSPTFLTLLLMSDSHRKHNISSLKMITYGTEPMPESTLKKLNSELPDIKLKQTYGLSELGILKTQSRNSDSLWIKLGGENFESRVVDGILWLRIKSSMLGYLNAPSPFTEDGWYNTGDEVKVDGDYFHILGRKSEIINVGGEKVYPVEIESILSELPGVIDVVVNGISSPITGQVVTASFYLEKPEAPKDLLRRVRQFCKDRLAPYKIPALVKISESPLHSERFKKKRFSAGETK